MPSRLTRKRTNGTKASAVQRTLRVPWTLVVSFKTEVLTEHLIETFCHRVRTALGLPLVQRLIVQNDICLAQTEVERTEQRIADDPVRWAQAITHFITSASGRFLTTSKRLPQSPPWHSSDSELAHILERWFRVYGETVGLIGVPARLDAVLERAVRDALRATRVPDAETAFRIIGHADQASGGTQERAQLLQLASRLTDVRTARAQKAIATHVRNYAWVQTTLLLGDLYTPAAVQAKVLALRREGHLAAKRSALRADITENQRQYQLLVRRHRFSLSHRRLFRALRTAVWFRTSRLEWLNQGCALARPFLTEVAQRLGISYDVLIYCFPDELLSALRGHGGLSSQFERRRRMTTYAMATLDGRHATLFLGSDMERLRQAVTHASGDGPVRGFPAFQAVVRGRVRIVKDRTELGTVRTGDVLVTKLTTPDFLPAMERAVAIVTDLGGITSHAAIVARELHKPCIVGTGNATTVLYNGDLVEVDAEKGVVRVVKRAR